MESSRLVIFLGGVCAGGRGEDSSWQVDEENPTCSIAIKCVCVFGNSRFLGWFSLYNLNITTVNYVIIIIMIIAEAIFVFRL